MVILLLDTYRPLDDWGPKKMNLLEKRMLDILKKGREFYGFTHVRAEFETEGTRPAEAIRLLEIAYKAGMELSLKIGGCEAVHDLYQARLAGVSSIVAPMVESTYALSKYIGACERCFPSQEDGIPDFFFNIETIQAFGIREDLIRLAQNSPLTGIVFGRVDFVYSLGQDRYTIESEDITHKILDVAALCKKHSLELVVGGGVSTESIDALRTIQKVHLSRFETRKIVFSSEILTSKNLTSALLSAIEFELLWLKNKQNYYATISQEDSNRISLLEQRRQLSTLEVAA